MLAADACAIGLGAVALGLLIAGPYREAFAGTPVTVRWTHALFASLAVLALAGCSTTAADNTTYARPPVSSGGVAIPLN